VNDSFACVAEFASGLFPVVSVAVGPAKQVFEAHRVLGERGIRRPNYLPSRLLTVENRVVVDERVIGALQRSRSVEPLDYCGHVLQRMAGDVFDSPSANHKARLDAA